LEGWTEGGVGLQKAQREGNVRKRNRVREGQRLLKIGEKELKKKERSIKRGILRTIEEKTRRREGLTLLY